MITTPFTAEEALTADLVPLDIDAVLFWMVWNPKDACVSRGLRVGHLVGRANSAA